MEKMHCKSTNLLNCFRELISDGLKLPQEKISNNQNLLELGADSLVLIDLISVIKTEYNVELSMIQFFEEILTLEDLVGYVIKHKTQEETNEP